MSQIFHQSVEDILRAATPEQKIVWNDLFLRYGQNASISQYYFRGAAAGTELATYVARKMYFGISLTADYTNGIWGAPAVLQLYNEANANIFNAVSNVPVYDVTAAVMRWYGNTVLIKNVVFSRLALVSYTNVIFIGYRIIY